MDPLAQVYTGQAGTGAAALTTQYDVLDQEGIHWKNYQQKQEAKANEAAARDKAIADIDKLAGSGWYPHREWINTRVDELRKHVTDAYVKGQDPFKGELGAKTFDLKREINDGVTTSGTMKAMHDDMRKLIEKDPDKYSLDSFNEVRDSMYDLDGVMSGQREIATLRNKPEKSKWFDAYKDMKPTLKSTKIEKGDITTSSKRANRNSNITQLAKTFAQMDDVTDVAMTYLPDEEIHNVKKYAANMDYIEDNYNYTTKMYEAQGGENPLTFNQYANAIIDSNEYVESKASTEYERLQDEPKKESGWSGRGYQGDDVNVNRGGEREYMMKTMPSYSFDDYSFGGKKMDKPIKLDATQFLDMSTGKSIKGSGGKNIVGDRDVAITNLMLLPVRNNQVLTGDKATLEQGVAHTEGTDLQWYVEGTMYDTEKVEEDGIMKSNKVERKVLIPYNEIKSKVDASYGFNLDDRDVKDMSSFELTTIVQKQNPNASKADIAAKVYDIINQQ